MRELPFLAIILTIFAVVLAIGAVINQDLLDDEYLTNNMSYAYNITDQALQGIDSMAGRQDTLGTVLIAGAIIAVIMSVFAFKQGY